MNFIQFGFGIRGRPQLQIKMSFRSTEVVLFHLFEKSKRVIKRQLRFPWNAIFS